MGTSPRDRRVFQRVETRGLPLEFDVQEPGGFLRHRRRSSRSAEVIDVATLKPLDFATIAESIAKTAGFGAEIAARCAEECMFDLVAPVERVTGYDTHIPLFRLEMKYLPSVEKIVAAAKRTLAAS